MAVRNISSIGRPKPIPVYEWIVPLFTPIYKVTITSGLITTDITASIISGKYTDGITNTIGDFSFVIDNSRQQYTSIFSLYDTLNIYLDYGSSATTLRFVGKIERLSTTDNTLVITGRSPAARVIGKNITYSAVSTTRSQILSDIISQNFSGILTTNNLQTDSSTVTVNYQEKPFWDIVTEICGGNSYDAYVDVNFDFHYFPSGSIQNTTEAIVHNSNLTSTGDFSPDLQTIYNKVRVYGATEMGITVFATSSDSTSISNYDVRDLKITDNSITSVAQAQARADLELATNKDPAIIGEIKSLMLPTIAPGERLRISDPLNGIAPSYYTIQKYTHEFSNDNPLQTTVTVQKERTSIPTILKKRLQFESQIQPTDNPNDMDHMSLISFLTPTGTLTYKTQYIEVDSLTNALTTTTTNPLDPGVWTSDLISVPADLTSYSVNIYGSNLGGVQIGVSENGGSNFLVKNAGQAYTPDNNFNYGLVIQLSISYSSTQITSVVLSYK